MTRLLWLAFEKSPHPDAVCVAVGKTDARCVLSLFALPATERRRYAEQFRNFTRSCEADALPLEKTVACRLPDGLCHFLNGRLVKWLACVLPAPQSVIEQTAGRIRRWLNQPKDEPVLRPLSGNE